MPEITSAQAATFHRMRVYQEGRLVIWSITTRTRDFGNRYVARPIVVDPSKGWDQRPREEDGFLIADTLEDVRAKLPYGLRRMDRHPGDDPVIVETWF